MPNFITITQHQTFLHFFKLSLRAIWKFKVVRIIILVFAIINLLSWLMAAIATGSLELYSLMYNLLTIGVFAGVYIFLAFLSTIFLWLSKPHFFKPITYQFDHWGIHLEGEGYTASVPWAKITKAEEKANAFIIYEVNILSFTIDKKNFENNEQIEAFKQLLHSQV